VRHSLAVGIDQALIDSINARKKLRRRLASRRTVSAAILIVSDLADA
jgi:hypothetical protein